MKNKFLLPELMKNDIHEPGNGMDKASSLNKNIFYNKSVVQNNPFFNKALEEIPETNYRESDMVQMG